jgi:hypothetical protein
MLRHCLISTPLGLLGLGAVFLLPSCGLDQQPAEGSNAAAGSGGAGGAPVEAPTLRFFLDEDPEASIEEQALIPEENRLIGVQVTPPDVYRVRFSIVPLDSAPPHDGSLDRTDAMTDPETGTAHVQLHAPSIVTQFKLQASIGMLTTAELQINIQSQGWAELQVLPEYTGHREVTEWVASAYLKVRCDELAQVTELEHGLPADAQYTTKSVFGIPPRFDVPVQPYMAITMRAGHYLFGCSNIDQPPINELKNVTVSLANIPIQLDDVSLDLDLGVQETTDEWLDHLQTAADDVLSAFVADSENDLGLVLATMASLLESEADRAAFEAAWANENWEMRALSSLASMDGLLLRNELASWLGAGSTALSTQATFVGRMRSPSVADGTAVLTLTSVAGVDAERAGFETRVPTSWSADPDDTIALGATLHWSPSALVSALAERAATSEYSEAQNLSDAFAALIDCEALAEALTDDTRAPSVVGDCDVACAQDLCSEALVELEKRAWDASDEEQELQLSATGAARVDDEARAVSFSGSWRGTFPMGESSAVGGTISGIDKQDGEE